jgi:hypothetical protein
VAGVLHIWKWCCPWSQADPYAAHEPTRKHIRINRPSRRATQAHPHDHTCFFGNPFPAPSPCTSCKICRYASFDYEEGPQRAADLTLLELLVNGKAVDALARLVPTGEQRSRPTALLGCSGCSCLMGTPSPHSMR